MTSADGLRALIPRLEWVMQFPCRTAPGLVFVGAQSRPAALIDGAPPDARGSHAGTGPDLDSALAACMGEAAEFLSQFERPGDLAPPDDPAPTADPLDALGPPWPSADRVRAVRLHDGAAVLAPADLCLRRADRGWTPPGPLSLGCAAGRSLAAARLAGLLEVVERDAAALWWRGGRPGRPVDMGDAGAAAAAGALAGWRAGGAPRATWFLDLSTDLFDTRGPACIAAISADPDGGRLCFGTAARPALGPAMLAAAREAIQAELALDLIAERRAHHGDAVLTATDRAALARAGLDAGAAALRATGAPSMHIGECDAAPEETLRRLVESLALRQHNVLCVDLARPGLDVPAAWVSVTGLQPEPSRIATPRLRAAMRDGRAGPEAPLF